MVVVTEACGGRLAVVGCSGDKLPFDPSWYSLHQPLHLPLLPSRLSLALALWISSNPTFTSHIHPPLLLFHTHTYIAFLHSADRSIQALCCNISAEWSGCIKSCGGKGEKREKTLFYPALHFNNPFPSDMEGEKGGMCEYMERGGGRGRGGGVGNTKSSDRDVCKTIRARELWVGMCAWGT